MSMELYDQVRASKTADRDFLQVVKDATRLDASNVARYYFEISDQEEWDLVKDFPCLIPPVSPLWIEMAAPHHMTSAVTGIISWDAVRHVYPARWAFLITGRRLSASRDAEMYDRGLRWIVDAAIVFPDGELLGQWQTPAWVWGFLLDEQGVMEAHPTARGGQYVTGPIGEYYGKLMGIYGSPDDPDYVRQHKETEMLLTNLLRPALLAITFMHAKNVTREAIDLPRPPQTAQQRRVNQWPLKPTQFYVLNIKPLQTLIEDALRAEGTPSGHVQRGMHLCRGHFKTYTADAPLLGKHTGTYFWGHQIRGTTADRTITKDYRVLPPEEQS